MKNVGKPIGKTGGIKKALGCLHARVLSQPSAVHADPSWRNPANLSPSLCSGHAAPEFPRNSRNFLEFLARIS